MPRTNIVCIISKLLLLSLISMPSVLLCSSKQSYHLNNTKKEQAASEKLYITFGQGFGYAINDISSPVDTTGFTLHGSNLSGGFSAHSFLDAGIMQHISAELGYVYIPTSKNNQGQNYIKTYVPYLNLNITTPLTGGDITFAAGFSTRIGVYDNLNNNNLDSAIISGTYTFFVPTFTTRYSYPIFKNLKSFIEYMYIGGSQKINQRYVRPIHTYNMGFSYGLYNYDNAFNESTAATNSNKFFIEGLLGYSGINWAQGEPAIAVIKNGKGGFTYGINAGINLNTYFSAELGYIQLPTFTTHWGASFSTKAKLGAHFTYGAIKLSVPIKK